MFKISWGLSTAREGGTHYSRVFLMVVTDPSLQLLILCWDKLLRGEVGVVRIVLHYIVTTLGWGYIGQSLV